MDKSPQLVIFETKDELLTAAQEQSSRVVVPELEQATKLYFIARFFVAVYESRFGKIPIQVWNEYRNALDHYFRHLTLASSDANEAEKHLKKMEGHLQRAVLDVLKLLCHKTIAFIAKERSRYSIDALLLVDNGNFVKNLEKSLAEAVALLENAKTSDLNLGDNDSSNDEVLNFYLDAAFAADSIRLNFTHRADDLLNAQAQHSSITNKAKNGSTLHHLKTHALFYILMLTFVYFLWNPLAKTKFESVQNWWYEDVLEIEKPKPIDPKEEQAKANK